MAKNIKSSQIRSYRRIFYLIAVFVIMGMSLLYSKTAYAYTEEEIQQAKAWLSAHGYSPDMGGASQAYEDYLNGKFDEELGYDTNGDGIPAATTEDGSSNSTEESTEKAENEKEKDTDKKEESVSDTIIPPGDAGGTAESGNQRNSEASADTREETSETASEVESGESERTTKASPKQKAIGKGNITLYCPEKKGCYQEGIIVIILAVVAMFVVDMFIHFQR